MASVKISQLTAAASVSGTQEFEINDSGTSKKVTGSQIKTYVFSGLTVSENDLNTRLMPSGGIIIWSGSSASIPANWYLCDGANGTPDLRDRFVVGAGTTYAVGATGGQNTITTVPAHTHGVGNLANASGGAHTHTGTTASVGDHTHNISSGGINGNINQPANTNNGSASARATSAAGGHSHTFTTDSGGAHTHTISGDVASSGSASVDVRPPYYALCYIMKA